MRIAKLSLDRFGHFSDTTLEFPSDTGDIHVIYGPNEAGKSTVMSAIEDLLFGIPQQSPYNFRYDYQDMRIASTLEDGQKTLSVVRRKGRKDTLLTPDGTPLEGEQNALRPFLGSVDRQFFERMFSLDHIRLHTGGQEILEAKDDVGQMLFSAGSGVSGLRELLQSLSSEADELWSSRRAKHRKFYIAEDKLKEAQKALRENTLTTTKWRELKAELQKANQVYDQVDLEIATASIESSKLTRIRRVYRHVRRKLELEEALTALDSAIELPEDSKSLLEEAEKKDAEVTTKLRLLREQLELVEQNIVGLTFDEKLVLRSADIRQLNERRIEIRRERSDLPKRRAELEAAEAEILHFATELEWPEKRVSEILNKIPTRTKIVSVRTLLAKQGEMEANATNHGRALKETQEALTRLRERHAGISEQTNTSKLAATYRAFREKG